MNIAQIAYFVIGLIVMTLFGASGYVFSFILGAGFSFANFEILKRLGLVLAPHVVGNPNAQKVGPLVSMLVLGKIMFWGLLLAFLVFTNKVQGIPFVTGMLSLVFAGLGLAIREARYART